jgi:phosphoglycerate kinase
MAPNFRTLDSADVSGKRVLVRVDLNVPMENGRITDATRIERVVPTINEIAKKGGKVILLAHFGRPKGRDPKESLKPVASEVARIIGKPVGFADDCVGEPAEKAIAAMKNGDVLLLENTRFHKEEEKNDPAFVEKLARLGDIYVNDAFSAAHRAHASTEGLAHKLPAYAGRAMQAELEALSKALEAPQRPVIAIVGGAKVSTKLDLLENLITKVQALVIGGAMANTFMHAQGVNVQKSLAEKDMADTARRILARAEDVNCAIILPVDAIVAFHFQANAPSHAYGFDAIPPNGMVLDIA